MPSPESLDFAALLQPISEDRACGPDLREDSDPNSTYRRLRAAWEAARDAERRVPDPDEEEGASTADWRPILELAPDCLARESKDLDVAAWLIDASARLRGFAGLRDALRLARELIESSWDELHPIPEDGDVSDKVRMLTAIYQPSRAGGLIAAIRLIPVTADTAAGEFNTYEVGSARQTESIQDEDKREERVRAGAVTMEMVRAAVAASPVEFLRDLRDDVRQAYDEFTRLTAVLDERCGIDDSPPSSSLNEVLETARDVVELLTRDRVPDVEPEPAASEEAPAGATEAPAGEQAAPRSAPSGEITNREEAFQAIERVSAFFRRAEPHSPVPYLLAQAVRWGRMPLPELVQQLMTDDEAKSTYYWLTGTKNPTD